MFEGFILHIVFLSWPIKLPMPTNWCVPDAMSKTQETGEGA